jgi:hypothetical protein
MNGSHTDKLCTCYILYTIGPEKFALFMYSASP